MLGAWLGQGQGSRPRLSCYSLPIPGARSPGHPVGQALLVPAPLLGAGGFARAFAVIKRHAKRHAYANKQLPVIMFAMEQ